jgi:hypothetical protein
VGLARLLAAELVGTFALVFAGAGAIMVDAKTHALGHVGVAITFGLVIMAMVYAVGHVSGAHFNPAVMFAFALTATSRGLGRPATGARSSSAHSSLQRCSAVRWATSRTSARRCRPARKASHSSGSSCSRSS